MANPNVGILEEIDDQHLSGISVGDGADANSISLASLCASCLASWAVGNDGWACTATVECQSNC